MTVPLVVRGIPAEPGDVPPGGLTRSGGPVVPGDLPGPGESAFRELYGDSVGYRVVERVVTAGARGSGEPVTLHTTPDDVLEIEDVDRVVTFHRAQRVADAALAARGRRGGPAGTASHDVLQEVARSHHQGRVAEVRQVRLTLPDAVRADLDILAETLPEQPATTTTGSGFDPAARAAMLRLAAWIDTPVADDAPAAVRRRRPKLPGLYRVAAGLRLEPGDRLPTAAPASTEPYLVLIHGTFSHTEAAFGALRDTAAWRDLTRQYEGRVLALEHPTLSLTPAQNALAVAELLPEGTPLHLLTHSRGGLVGDVLSLASSRDALDLGAYRACGRPDHPDLETLPQLCGRLRGRGVTVRRFARVAAPARGTTLASRRVDRYATYLFNALRLMPGPDAGGTVELVQKLALTLLDQRSDPRIVPGLEAQMPESPLIRLLNTGPAVDDGLGNVTGDIEGSGIARRLIVFGADLFYRADNDLVVNTGSMSGGLPRKRGRTRFFQGPEVNHSAYFANETSRTAVRDWLMAPDDDVPGFVPGGTAESASRAIRGPLLSRAVTQDDRWADDGDRTAQGIVVVLPDVLGSHLPLGRRAAWPDGIGRIAEQGVAALLEPPDGSPGPTDLIPAYGPLVNALRAQYAVKQFSYDPRLPTASAVAELQALMPELLRKAGGRVHLVAHGYGCRLVLDLRDADRGAWTARQRGGGRTVLLSPPFFGTWTARRRVAGRDGLCAALALLDPDPEVTPERVGAMLGQLAAYRDLQPVEDRDTFLRRRAGLQGAGWEGVCAVFGRDARTPWLPLLERPAAPHVESERGSELGSRRGPAPSEAAPNGARVPGPDDVTSRGDGYVGYEAAELRGLPTWFAPVPFADLPGDANTAQDVVRLLTPLPPAWLIGAPPPSVQVASGPGAARSGSEPDVAGISRPVADEPAPLFPDPAELARLALGAGAPVEVPRDELHVTVVHGDVSLAQGCLVVGTYDGTPIGGSEAALDARLDGALRRHRLLGQYPGRPGTCQLFSHQGDDRRGRLTAAVIGLGDPGDLTAGRLTGGITQAALRLAARRLDREAAAVADGADPERIRMTLTTVLIGTTGAAALPIGVALPAIVAGVRRANRRLADQRRAGQPLDVVVDGLCIVERYEERAADAVRAAVELAGTAGAEEGELVVDSAVRDGAGGLPGNLRVADRGDMWRTIRVTALPPPASPGSVPAASAAHAGPAAVDGGLVELAFTSVGRTARAEQRVRSGQREIIESLVASCIDDPAVDRQIYNTLYELIVPNSLKAQGRESENLMFVLDDAAARLPFEMLATRSDDGDDEPLAIAVGLVRRLESDRFREGVRLATGARALVIGDPPTTRFQRLPGAIREARAVAATLEEFGFEVTRLIPRDVSDTTSVDPVKIMNALFGHDYRIIHIAAHGDVDPDDPTRSGVVIGDRAFLTALEIRQMQTSPDLFFLNCCHLGSMTPRDGTARDRAWRPDRLAAGIARELIDIGTRAVVAAGWAVDDEQADVFARTFYRRMLSGDDLGTASRTARRAVYPRPDQRQVNTWGAYQVYGPPALMLTPAGDVTDHDLTPRSRSEFLQVLNRLAARADRARTRAETEDVRAALEEAEAGAPAGWLDGPAHQALGDAYRNLGDHAATVAAYRRALESWGSAASLRTIDRLITACTRWGVALSRDPATRAAAADCFAEAERLLDGLDRLIGDQPPERISLRGGYYRRRLLIGADLDRTLVAAHEAYARAARLHRDRDGEVDPYTTLRAVALGWALALRTGRRVPRGSRAQVEAAAARLAAVDHPDDWVKLARVDARLLLLLLSGGRNADPVAVGRAYQAEFAGSSVRARRSVMENLEILRRCLPTEDDDHPSPTVASAAAALETVQAAVERWQPDQAGGYSGQANDLDS